MKFCFFFFQAEDGIRDRDVTGVQTCALPISPGAEYPVFDADFGKVGMMICWDHWFPEPARILRLKGAELLVLPIAGDGDTKHWDITSRARAIDNGVYLVASSTVAQSPSRIVDPTGEVLAETLDPFGIAVSDIDLDREDRLHWLSVGPADGEAPLHPRAPSRHLRHPQRSISGAAGGPPQLRPAGWL